jgi:hypothetical protein
MDCECGRELRFRIIRGDYRKKYTLIFFVNISLVKSRSQFTGEPAITTNLLKQPSTAGAMSWKAITNRRKPLLLKEINLTKYTEARYLSSDIQMLMELDPEFDFLLPWPVLGGQ